MSHGTAELPQPCPPVSPSCRARQTPFLPARRGVPLAALVAACDEWWEAVTDGLADDKADVILAALAATNKLFQAAETATHGATAMRNSTQRAALRMCLAMGPLIDTWRMLPSHAQVCGARQWGCAAVRLPAGNYDSCGQR